MDKEYKEFVEFLDSFLKSVNPDFKSLHDEVMIICSNKRWHDFKNRINKEVEKLRGDENV